MYSYLLRLYYIRGNLEVKKIKKAGDGNEIVYSVQMVKTQTAIQRQKIKETNEMAL